MDSEFLRWFEEQYGTRPIPTGEEGMMLLDALAAGDKARRRLKADELYTTLRSAALKAWCAARGKMESGNPSPESVVREAWASSGIAGTSEKPQGAEEASRE